MSARNYSSVARSTTLTSGVSGASTGLAVTETTGFPSVPYTLVVDPGRSEEEAITVTTQVGLNLTVLRGQDGTSAQPHDAGATVRHMATARDFREPAEHIELEAAVHGVISGLVGEVDDQILDNKTFQAGVTDHTAVAFKAATGQTAPLLVFSDAAGSTLGSVSTAGRVTTPGVDGTSSTTLTAGTAATVPLIVKGAASQSASLASFRDSASAVVASVSPTGVIAGSGVTATGTVTADTVAATTSTVTTENATTVNATTVNVGTVNGSAQSVFSPSTTATVPLVAKVASGHSVSSFSVRDSTNLSRTGVWSEAGGFQLYQGSLGNYVPFRIHCGTDTMTMSTGESSSNGSINLTSYGFNAAPIMSLTVRQENESAQKRRVCVNIEGAVTTTACNYRVVQTANDPLPDNTNYIVHWIAIQYGPTTAAG